jgi:predicted nucleic acid-binding protein
MRGMAEQWVVDASVVAKIYLKDEDDSALADELITRYASGLSTLIAPQLILYEVPSTILRAARVHRIDATSANRAIREFFSLDLPTVGDDATIRDMIGAAYSLAVQLGCTLYDALYLGVANEFGYPLVTADQRLHRGVADKVGNIVMLADYKPVP